MDFHISSRILYNWERRWSEKGTCCNLPPFSELKQLPTPPTRVEWGVEKSQDNSTALLHCFLALFYWSEENSLCYSHCFIKDVERLQILLLLLCSFRIQESFLVISLDKSSSSKIRNVVRALPLPALQSPQKFALPHTSGAVSHFSSFLLSGANGKTENV